MTLSESPRRWAVNAVILVGALLLCEVLLHLAASISPPLSYILRPYWNRAFEEDQLLGKRGSPFAEGHDSRGFRNKTALDSCDLLAVGDSLTYGYAAVPEESWPSLLGQMSGWSVYNMSMGGYSPCEYARLVEEGLELEPRIVVVGLFLGNDIADAYRVVWENGRCQNHRSTLEEVGDQIESANSLAPLRPFGDRSGDDNQRIATQQPVRVGGVLGRYSNLYALAREVKHRASSSQALPRFIRIDRDSDAFKMAATRPGRVAFDEDPKVRTVFLKPDYMARAVDLQDPRIREGARITVEVLSGLEEELSREGIRLLVALLPSKHVVYLPLLQAMKNPPPDALIHLIHLELELKEFLLDQFEARGLESVDATESLRDRLQAGPSPYPEWDDSHPNGVGYEAVAKAILSALHTSDERVKIEAVTSGANRE